MAYTTIDKPDDYFNTVLYTGTGATQSITGVGFQPDWVWIKDRDDTFAHQVHDSVRGASAGYLSTDTNGTEQSSYPISSFDSDGWTTKSGGTGGQNQSGDAFVSWNWLAGGTASSNTDGSITSSVSANTTAGFSIVSYTGNGTGGATIGHGLATTPQVIIIKNRDDSVSSAWSVYHHKSFVSASNPNILYLNLNVAEQDDTNVHHTTTTFNSTVFSLGNYNGTNGSGDDIIAYCFAEKKGYSKFGSYIGNGNADGSFIFTGFKPAWVMIKRTDSANNWYMYDNKRNTFNAVDKLLQADQTNAEATQVNLDFTSSGFKLRATSAKINASGGAYIYMAFAENPFVTSTGIPCTAR